MKCDNYIILQDEAKKENLQFSKGPRDIKIHHGKLSGKRKTRARQKMGIKFHKIHVSGTKWLAHSRKVIELYGIGALVNLLATWASI